MTITEELKATATVLRIPPAKRGCSRPVNQERVVAQAMVAARARHRRELAKMIAVAGDVRRTAP